VWIDPARLRRNSLPPPVTINGLRLDEQLFREPASIVVPAHTNSVVIAFSAVSLGMPERVRVRYRMEGADKDWIEAGSLRQVSYNDLGPGRYRFHVIAANEDGVWNTKGAVLKLTVEPTFLQSTSFRILCATILGILLWAVYSIRTRQLTARVRERLETRHGERERIARELHDTLLQGFQGLVLRFQSVANRMPPDSELRPSLDQALEQAENVLTEGRNRVSDLRASEENSDLAGDIAQATKDLGVEAEIPITVTVEGLVRPLEPIVREELLRISEEAVRNAIRHASPSKIEVGLVYARQLRLGIRDDGSGLPQDVALAGQRQGHFGLVGMRERAERAGGRLELSTSPGAGTEIRVTVSGRLAYLKARQRRQTTFKISRT
jgi:signal transduction histidine kinase